MAGNTTSNDDDDQMNSNTYKSVMDFSTRIGLPAAAGITVMFTSLVLAKGIFIALIAGGVTYLFANIVVKSFFSH
ncbi:MAG: hypothetical protein AAGH42_11570 [Pseudomonadota bacterium]